MNLKIQFKLCLLLFLLPFIVAANNTTERYKNTEQKTVSKSFNVNANATLEVNNSFGNINVITWNENRIEFEISIKVSGNNSEKIEERLKGITIDFDANTNYVSAVTKIKKHKSSWWNWGNKMNLKMEIDYIIKAPITNNVYLRNRFGTITLDQLKGDVKIDCEHGSINTKELLSDSNKINLIHTRDCYFESIINADISASHSGLTVANAKNITLRSEHSRATLELVEKLNFKSYHGSLKVNNVNQINGEAQHLSLRIKDLYKNANLETHHGSLKISKIASGLKNLTIDATFTGITLGYSNASTFDFDVDLDFGSLRDAKELNFKSKDVNMHSKRYRGFYGSENSGNLIRISNQHGSVSFKKI